MFGQKEKSYVATITAAEEEILALKEQLWRGQETKEKEITELKASLEAMSPASQQKGPSTEEASRVLELEREMQTLREKCEAAEARIVTLQVQAAAYEPLRATEKNVGSTDLSKEDASTTVSRAATATKTEDESDKPPSEQVQFLKEELRKCSESLWGRH